MFDCCEAANLVRLSAKQPEGMYRVFPRFGTPVANEIKAIAGESMHTRRWVWLWLLMVVSCYIARAGARISSNHWRWTRIRRHLFAYLLAYLFRACPYAEFAKYQHCPEPCAPATVCSRTLPFYCPPMRVTLPRCWM